MIPTMLSEPTLDQILDFCAEDPIERVFLEDVARRGFARFRAVESDGRLAALCYFGANVVPSGLREATIDDLDLLLPACAATHREELGVDPLERDPEGFRRRTLAQIHEGRSWLWAAEDGTILFKAEASAWTPAAVQLQQVWVDPEVRNLG